jgi:sugar/nucleoside kinase (ribokinase family)
MLEEKFDCIVIGDVILDVFVGKPGTGAVFQIGGTSYCESASIEFGGAGNVADALSLLGAKASFVGRAGNDLWGRLYKANLAKRNVRVAMTFDRSLSTGLSLVSISENGERSFCVFRGANNTLSKRNIDNSIGLIKNSEYLYCSGYSLVADPQRSAIVHAIEIANKNRVKVFLDPGAYNLIENNIKLFEKLVDLCDVFCPNIEEAKALTQSRELKAVISKLQKTGKLVALKYGKKGCILIEGKKCIKIPGVEVKCTDTTGAGDAFSTAFLYGLVNHLPLSVTGKLANWFAAQVSAGVGARSFPPSSKIDAIIEAAKISNL